MEGVRASFDWAKNKNGPELKIPLHSVTLRAPLPSPGKLMCLAGNYASHIEEGGGSYIGKGEDDSALLYQAYFFGHGNEAADPRSGFDGLRRLGAGAGGRRWQDRAAT